LKIKPKKTEKPVNRPSLCSREKRKLILTLKDYFAKYTRTHKNHKNTYFEIVIVNCQVQLLFDNMVLANQNAKLTGPDQGFLVSPPRPHTKALGTRLRQLSYVFNM
jgi:hypothetical protein